ncbi:MAG TPA: hypothetical protein VGE35_02510 [Candidatus Paceibacterota bacterium]
MIHKQASRRAFLQTFVSAALGMAVIGSSFSALPSRAEAAAPDWIAKSVSITSQWPGDWASENFKQSVRNARDMGATGVNLVVPYIQTNTTSSDIGNAPNTPSDETLIGAIDFIHGLGMKVTLKPHLEDWTANWRGNIRAENRDEWYSKYSAMLNHLGEIGESHDVEMIVVGTELIGMASSFPNQDNTARWETMIASLRSNYSGLLTYSANWGIGNNYENEFENIKFWNSLDYIGISAYFPIASDGSAQSVVNAWRDIDNRQVSVLQSAYNKPIIFTEVGYKSADGAHARPWDSGMSGAYNAAEQDHLYQGLFEYWNTKSYFAGIMIWDWHSDPNHGGEGNTDYSPHNKPAESTIRTWFTKTTPTDPNPPTGTSTDPTSFETEIWWPTNNAWVSGLQPFKIMVQNKPVSEYESYWSVDSGDLVHMYSSDEDYPHKEAWVEFTGWTWKGSGPYTITFTSKNLSGAVISQKSVDIYVAQ